MPINPNIPRSRDEMLLDAIATGDTTNIVPRDREEIFLKAIADKIGEGGGLPEYSGEESAFLGYYRDDEYNLVMGWRENVILFVNASGRLYKNSAKTQPVTDTEMINWLTSGITVMVNNIPSYSGVIIMGYQGGVAIAFKSWTGDNPEFYKYTTY